MPINRTDLAMECFENADGGAVPGAQVNHWETDGIEIPARVCQKVNN